MRGKSHLRIAQYLIDNYMSDAPKRFQTAFRFGCIEPDRNPATYLKGSIRFQWLRGHNYQNARQCMQAAAARLERKEHLNLFDYYVLGKLIHYTTDAFTYAHNDFFPRQLKQHIAYEQDLQEHFLAFIDQSPKVEIPFAHTIMEAISKYHDVYEKTESNIYTDSRFALNACCCVFAILCLKPIL